MLDDLLPLIGNDDLTYNLSDDAVQTKGAKESLEVKKGRSL